MGNGNSLLFSSNGPKSVQNRLYANATSMSIENRLLCIWCWSAGCNLRIICCIWMNFIWQQIPYYTCYAYFFRSTTGQNTKTNTSLQWLLCHWSSHSVFWFLRISTIFGQCSVKYVKQLPYDQQFWYEHMMSERSRSSAKKVNKQSGFLIFKSRFYCTKYKFLSSWISVLFYREYLMFSSL